MPRLWDHTLDAHRDAVRGAVLDAAWALAAEQGLAGVTMATEQAIVFFAVFAVFFFRFLADEENAQSPADTK